MKNAMLQRFGAAGATGPMAQLLNAESFGEIRGLVAEMRAAAPLPEDAQKLIDDAVVSVGLERLIIAGDLLTGGLTFPVPDAMGVMEVQWEQISKAGGAQRSMTPSARGEDHTVDRNVLKIPLFITSDDFSIGVRLLMAAQRVGTALDTSLVTEATRRVNEAVEDQAINGGLTVSGNASPGLLAAPNVNTQAYVDNEAWTHANHSGEDILVDVLNMIDELQTDKHYGPYNLYLPTAYGSEINKDFKAASDKTTRQRLEEIVAGGRGLKIATADQLPTDRVALVEMNTSVIDIITGMAPTAVPWVSADGWTMYWMVLAIQVVRPKDDYDGNSGICMGNTS